MKHTKTSAWILSVAIGLATATYGSLAGADCSSATAPFTLSGSSFEQVKFELTPNSLGIKMAAGSVTFMRSPLPAHLKSAADVSQWNMTIDTGETHGLGSMAKRLTKGKKISVLAPDKAGEAPRVVAVIEADRNDNLIIHQVTERITDVPGNLDEIVSKNAPKIEISENSSKLEKQKGLRAAKIAGGKRVTSFSILDTQGINEVLIPGNRVDLAQQPTTDTFGCIPREAEATDPEETVLPFEAAAPALK
jgi:hypothetical protein